MTITKGQDGLLYVAFSPMLLDVPNRSWERENFASDGKESKIYRSQTDTNYYYLTINPVSQKDNQGHTRDKVYGNLYKDNAISLSVKSEGQNTTKSLSFNSGEHQYYKVE